MVSNFSDACNGVYKCKNFLQRFEDHQFPEFPIGWAGGFSRWYVLLSVENRAGRLRLLL
ncbi:unnamed protein product [Caenorhabditis brenneri]